MALCTLYDLSPFSMSETEQWSRQDSQWEERHRDEAHTQDGQCGHWISSLGPRLEGHRI